MTEQESGGAVVPDRVGQATAGTLDGQHQVVMAAEILAQAAQRRLECRRPARCQYAEDVLQPLARHQLVARPLQQWGELLLTSSTQPVAPAPDVEKRQAADTKCPAQRRYNPAEDLEDRCADH